ncbi:hypothetical protein C5S53_12470 [Methanophagales archaeon]|nr:hypothetical protein C5S53_12470 [Methanophagales archaeon]
MVWPTPLTPGTYDLIIDLDVSGYPYVWTNITNPYSGSKYIEDPVLTIDVAGPSPLEPADVYIDIDIKPKSCPNPINVGKQGLQSVAVLGTLDFDVSTIDNSTIQLTREGYEDFVEPLRWSYEDVGTPYEGELCGCHDLGDDGYIDLTLKFKTQDLVTELNLAEVVGDILPLTLTLTLTGELDEDGKSFIKGHDCIWVL